MSKGVISAIDGGWDYPQPEIKEIVDVVTVLVLPILLSLCIGMTIYYALHPVQPMIQITANFSLSLPVVVCGSSGLAIGFVLRVQACRHKQVANSFGSTTSGLIRHFVHSGRRDENQTIAQYEEINKEYINLIEQITNSSHVTFTTRDGVSLSGYWHEAGPNKPTAILFPCNGGISNPTLLMASAYQENGFNVLIPEYRGYGRSEGTAGGPNQELEAYLDAEAALNFAVSLKNIPIENVIAHGYSLGGAYAASLGLFYSVRTVILDHTFTSLSDLANTFFPLPWNQLMGNAFGKLKYSQHPTLSTAQELVTDGFDTAAKLQKMQHTNVCVICGTDDWMIPTEMAEDLVKARYPHDTEQQKKSLVLMSGDHNDGHLFFDNENGAARDQWWKFLQDNH